LNEKAGSSGFVLPIIVSAVPLKATNLKMEIGLLVFTVDRFKGELSRQVGIPITVQN
jgi:hypothetical protein